MRIYETYWKMMCHFCIYATISSIRSQGVDHKVLASYLFHNLNNSLEGIASHKVANKDEIERHITKTGYVSYTAEFESWYSIQELPFYQSRFPVLSRDLIAGFIML